MSIGPGERQGDSGEQSEEVTRELPAKDWLKHDLRIELNVEPTRHQDVRPGAQDRALLEAVEPEQYGSGD